MEPTEKQLKASLARADLEEVQVLAQLGFREWDIHGDVGPGVARGLRDRIFERFWSAQQQRRPGTGLGLAIARGLVELRGGAIWVERPPSGGARFCFTIPIAIL